MKKYDINYQLLGLASYSTAAENDEYDDFFGVIYSLSDIRSIFTNAIYADGYKKAAQDCVEKVQGILRHNLGESLGAAHKECPSCECVKKKPSDWNIEMIERFLSIPIEDVHRIEGGW